MLALDSEGCVELARGADCPTPSIALMRGIRPPGMLSQRPILLLPALGVERCLSRRSASGASDEPECSRLSGAYPWLFSSLA